MYLNLFSWNVKNNRKTTFYADLGVELKIRKTDILIMQECYIYFPCPEIADFEEIADFADENGSNTLRIFLNKKSGLLDSKATSYLNNKQRCVLLQASDGFKFNLVGIHLYSVAGKSTTLQLSENNDVGLKISEFITMTQIEHTLVVGDFNYMPFHQSLQSHMIFNAVNVKEVVRNMVNRRIAQRDHAYYYNPMWNLLGDYDYVRKMEKVPGTYYLDTIDPEQYHWSLIDGVVLSKSLMDNLLMDSLEIVTMLNGNRLLNNKRAGKKNTLINAKYSDHLPISFTIKTT